MAQHFSKPPTAPQPFSEAQDPALTSGLFWLRLLAYRPLFLLGGLWLTLVCVSAIAYHGLMANEPAPDIAHREAPIAIAAPLPQDLAPNAAANAGDGESAGAEPTGAKAPQLSTVTLWGLLSLVGLCAFGCFVLTQQIKASSRPKRKKLRPVAKAAAPARPPHPKRLTPYVPERDDVVVPGARAVNAVDIPPAKKPAAFRPVKPVSPVPSAVPQTWPQPLPVAVSQAQARTPTVVPDGADISLDYPEGSVAHALDVRQRRSLSSFM